MVLKNIEPKKVMQFFEMISAIPRGSKKEKQMSDWLVNFAKEHQLEVIQDKNYNVIIRKPATPGYEKVPMIILQGHMDIVWEKNKNVNHDFETQGVELEVQGNFITAKGTTLGADNGIAVAMCLTLLDSTDIPHPALEVLITTDEEAGMGGAIALDGSLLKGKTLINIDSEEEGAIYASCAGGAYFSIDIPLEFEKAKESAFEVTLTGLKGGHSGMQINEERGNANKLLARFLFELSLICPFHLSSLKGGSKRNAIPREAEAVILFPKDKEAAFKSFLTQYISTIKKEYSIIDADVTLEYKAVALPDQMMNRSTTDRVVMAATISPNGIQTMSLAIPGLVESSLNLGVIVQDQQIHFEYLIRSCVGSKRDFIVNQLKALSALIHAKYQIFGSYDAWEYNSQSKIRDVVVKVFKEKYKKEPEIKAIHAGLECGILGGKMGDGADMVSIGPNLFDVHSPDEKMDIKSAQNTWESLLEILKLTKDFY